MVVRLTNQSVAGELSPKFIDWTVGVSGSERHVFEATAERVVVADVGPVDAHGRVDGRLDVLGIDVALPRPAGIDSGRAQRIGRADHLAALYSAAGEEGELV